MSEEKPEKAEQIISSMKLKDKKCKLITAFLKKL